jgi:hypothetical protein
MDSRTIALDSKDLEGGIEALSNAARAFRLTPFERGVYHALLISVFVTAWSAITLILLAVLLEHRANVGNVVHDVGLPALIVMVCGLCLATVALVLNIPLAARLYRERGRLRELGLASLSKSLWKARWRGRWISRAFRWGPTIAFIFALAIAYGEEIADPDPVDVVIFALLLSMFIVVLLVLSGYLRNQRERMEIAASAEELKKGLQSLQQLAGKSEKVSVPSELLEQAARIETAQIAKERKDAVLQSVSAAPSGYGVAFDPAAAEQRRMLDVPDRVELEDVVAQLSIEGPDKLKSDAGAAVPPEGAIRRGETNSKRVEFEYVVDRASHGIRIVAVRRQDHSNSSLQGASHA